MHSTFHTLAACTVHFIHWLHVTAPQHVPWLPVPSTAQRAAHGIGPAPCQRKVWGPQMRQPLAQQPHRWKAAPTSRVSSQCPSAHTPSPCRAGGRSQQYDPPAKTQTTPLVAACMQGGGTGGPGTVDNSIGEDTWPPSLHEAEPGTERMRTRTTARPSASRSRSRPSLYARATELLLDRGRPSCCSSKVNVPSSTLYRALLVTMKSRAARHACVRRHDGQGGRGEVGIGRWVVVRRHGEYTHCRGC